MNPNNPLRSLLVVLFSFILINNIYLQQESGRSLDFDGIDDYVDQVSVPFTPNWTFEAWIKKDGNGDFQRVFDFGDDVNNYMMFTPKASSGFPRFVIRKNGTGHVLEGSAPLDNNWNHIAITVYDNTILEFYEYKMYINGVLQVPNTSGIHPGLLNGSSNRWLGRSQFSEDDTYDGKIDEVRIWNVARSEQEIMDWMDCELSGSEPGLYSYFQMNDGIDGQNNMNGGSQDYAMNMGTISDAPAYLKNFGLVSAGSNWSADRGFNTDPTSQNCVEFQLRGDTYTLNNESNFDFTEAYTIQCWVFQHSFRRAKQSLIDKGNPNYASSSSFFIEIDDDDDLIFGQRASGQSQVKISASNVLDLNKWQHLTFTAEEIGAGVEFTIYVDGIVTSQQFINGIEIPQNDSKVNIGSEFKGKISNIQFWNKRLEDSQIIKNKSTIFSPGTAGLVAQYVDYTDFSTGLKDTIGNNTGLRSDSPIFTSDPCFVLFKEQPENIKLDDFGNALSLSAELYACTLENFSYQWKKDGIEIPGENALTFNIPSTDVNDLGIYTLDVEACDGQLFTSREALVSINNQGEVLKFDGEDDYVTFSTALNSFSSTIEAWVRFNGDPSNQSIIVLTDGRGLENYFTQHLRVNKDGYFEFSTLDPTPSSNEMVTVRHPEKPVPNQWYHIAGRIINEFSIAIDVNGVQGEVKGQNNLADGTIFYIGQAACGHDNFNGEIDELRIWRTSTNTMGIDTLTNNTDLEHNYLFNEGIDGGDNTLPDSVNTVIDPFSFSTANLYNFQLKGDDSNWLRCGHLGETISITSQPRDTLVGIGASLILEVIPDNIDNTETYQWYKNNEKITGSTLANHTISNILPEDAGAYYVVVNRFNGCKTYSAVANVAVKGTGEVINLDGINDHLVINTQAPSTEYTIELWVKLEDNVESQNIIVATDDQGPYSDISNQLFTDENGYFTHFSYDEGNDINRVIKSDNPASVDEWYHVAIRASGLNGMQMVIDGIVQSDVSVYGTSWSGVQHYFVGSKGYSKSGMTPFPLNPFEGEIDELRIWSVWKSDVDINASKDVELVAPTSGLTHYYQFNQGYADSDNQYYSVGMVPNNSDLTNKPIVGDMEMKNFGLTGEISNWSGCSPVTSAQITYLIEDQPLLVGMPLVINIDQIVGDTSSLSYQWRRDDVLIPGATQPTFYKENLDSMDLGIYDVIISDNCTPVLLDTILVGLVNSICYKDLAMDTIKYPSQSQYIGCTVFNGNGCMADPNPVNDVINFGYCDSELNYPGGEAIYFLELQESQLVELSLSNITSDVDLFILGEGCNLDQCFASSTQLANSPEFISVVLPAGDYYIIIDTKSETIPAEGFVLDVTLYENLCFQSIPLSCGSTISGNTADGTASVINNLCGDELYIEKESVYEVTILDTQTLIINLSNLSVDLDLFLLDSLCVETNCLASSLQPGTTDEAIVFGAQPGTYYIVVDGKNGNEGTFDLSFNCQEYFSATVNDNDAYIDLTWSIDKKICVPQDTGIIIRLITTPNTILYEEEFGTAALTPDIISGSFRHYVGESVTRNYVLRVYNRLSNSTICEEVKMGQTLPFQAPEILSISNMDYPDSIRVEWRNHSKLSDEFRILRDGNQIVNLIDGYTEDSLIISYVDVHDINNGQSVQEDSSYQYCIQTYSSNLNKTYPQVCAMGSTYNINFQASDTTFSDKVSLTWNDVSSFCTGILIRRNGIQEALLSPDQVSYNDLFPIYGENTSYSLTLMEGNMEKMEVFDNGYVLPNGIISGKALTLEGNYPIINVEVSLIKTSSQQVINTTYTDFQGAFIFEDIVYGISSDFEVIASKPGSTFNPSSVAVNLNEALPTKENILLFDDSFTLTTQSNDLIDTLFANIMSDEDIVSINWDYQYNSNDTIFFNLLRNGVNIFSVNDAGGKINQFVDLTGIPNNAYMYSLEAFNIEGENILIESKKISATYPAVTPLPGYDVYKGDALLPDGAQDFDPRLFFDWSNYNHPSLNYNGFQILQNDSLIAVVDTTIKSYLHIPIPGSTGIYEIRAFRKIGNVTHQSIATPIDGDTIQANILWKPNILLPAMGLDSDRAITIDLDLSNNFYQFAIYDGILFERKKQSEPDSAFTEIGSLTKTFIVNMKSAGIDPVFWDKNGVPGELYDYRISTFIYINGNKYGSNGTVIQRTCPDVAGPINLHKGEQIGQVGLGWTDNSEIVYAPSQKFIQYEGIEISRRVIHPDSNYRFLSVLQAKKDTFNDYLNNPVYNLFLNAYETLDYQYELKAFLDIGSDRYYSAPVEIDAKPLPGNITEPLPTAFTASNNIPGHIKLCWEWQATKQSKFIIFRDTVAIDTLPFTARAYYDYNAPSDPTVLYSIVSYFGNNSSAKVYAEGSMPSFKELAGRVYNYLSGSGIGGVVVTYKNKENVELNIPAGLYQATTITDSSGSYIIYNIPGIQDLQLDVSAVGDNVDFDQSIPIYSGSTIKVITIDSSRKIKVDFLDYQAPVSTNTITEVGYVTLTPNPYDISVEIKWSPENANYDGFEIFRLNKKLGTVLKGANFEFLDSTGFYGIEYSYGVRAFKDTPEGRIFSKLKNAAITFPRLEPVENLTATSFFNKNLMLISWSHPYDNHDAYRIKRNDIIVAIIPAGSPLMWYDSTGIPGKTYQYEVVAIKQNLISDPAVVVKRYRGVGEVSGLSTQVNNTIQACSGVSTNENNVTITWNYIPGAAQGFEIYRDNVLIGEIDSTLLTFGNLPLQPGQSMLSEDQFYYKDYMGSPGENHIYHVLAYIERNEERFTSGVEELYPVSSIEFPDLAEIKGLDASANEALGVVEVYFEYGPDVVTGFKILRDGIAIDTIIHTNQESYVYMDSKGIPGSLYTYSVQPFGNRKGIDYEGAGTCFESVTYPVIPIPQNLTASNGEFSGHIEVNWVFNTEILVDSFFLENTSLGITYGYRGGKRKHIDIVNDFIDDRYSYRVRAYRRVDQQDIYSEWSMEDEGWAINQTNGDENETTEGFCSSASEGWAVAIDGNWAVSGAPGGLGSFTIYHRVDGGWSKFQVIDNPLSLDAEFGFSVAISGNKLVIGAPKVDKVYAYTYDGSTWGYPAVISGITNSRFGHSLDIDGDDLIIGAPREVGNPSSTADQGAIYFYQYNNGLWDFINAINGHLPDPLTPLSLNRYFGSGVALHNGLATAYLKRTNNTVRTYIYFKSTAGQWIYKDFSELPFTFIPLIPEDNLDMHEDHIVVRQQSDFLRIYDIQSDTTIGPGIELLIQDLGINSFGNSVSITKIPSPITEKYYILASTPTDGSNNEGQVHLIEKVNSNTWSLVKTYTDSNPEQNDNAGRSVAISRDAIMYGIPGKKDVNIGATTLINLIETTTFVSATDGISVNNDLDKTTIYWEYEADQRFVTGFNIYRDGEKIATRSVNTLSQIDLNTYAGEWDDNSGKAGQHYVYSVKASNNFIPFESYGLSDEGYNSPNGKIQGSVLTAISGSPVPGVSIMARGIVDGEVYEYSGTTFANGEYILNDVFYDHDPENATEYKVSAQYEDHIILPTITDIALLNSLNNPVFDVVDFEDETAYVITGTLRREEVSCSVEGIKVFPIINGTPSISDQTSTDKDGKYSLVINPLDPGLNTLGVGLENFVTSETDTIYYGFEPVEEMTFTSFIDFPLETVYDFMDTLTYPVTLKVKNTCENPISTGKWDIRIRTLDGCFDKLVTTNTSGEVIVNLLPLNYTVKVVGVDVISTINQKALDYFSNESIPIKLFDIHKDTFNIISKEEIGALASRDFIYHVAPEITIFGINDFFCNQPVAVFQQNDEYSLSFDITESHGGLDCPVQVGKIKISNPAAADNNVAIISYDENLLGFPDYTFTAGTPNQISPYLHAITVDYLTDENEFLGRKSFAAFVEGSVRLPGADFIVDPTAGNGFVPLPVMILRDPPGDNSSSYISAGQTINYTTSVEEEIGGSGEVFANTSFDALGGTVSLGATFTTGGSDLSSKQWSSELTVSQTITTSDDETQIGESADIIIGQGLVMTYGIINNFSVGNCDTIVREVKYALSPDGASTTWSYTIQQIENIITGYQNDSIRAENGEFAFEENGKVLTKDKTIEKLESYIENWKEVLLYHRETTLPHHHICAQDPAGITSVQKAQIDGWQANLCPLLGTGSGSNFKLNEEILWSDPTVDMYNAAHISIINIAEGNSPLGQWSFPANGNIYSILNRPEVQGSFGTYGAPVENIATGGTITIEQSFANVNASTRTHRSNFYISQELTASYGFSKSLTVFGGVFAGIGAGVVGGVIKNLASFEIEAGVKAAFNFSLSNERSNAIINEVETGYTLLDNDVTDQLGVVVIQPIAQNHTAFFDYFGGRSSCPPEEGSIFVDDPLIAIIDSSGGNKPSAEFSELPPTEALAVPLVIKNNSPFTGLPARFLEVFLDPSSNENGAIVELNGISLNNGTYVSSLSAQEEDTLILSIEKGATFFEYPDLRIGIRPACGFTPVEYITISAFFKSPCSPVTLIAPDNGWVINDDTTKLVVTMQDYDPLNPNLDYAVVEYRRIGAGLPWEDIPIDELERGNLIVPDSLLANDASYLPGQIPKYTFIWTIPPGDEEYPDGTYELRVRMQCNNFSTTLSNVVSGTIARDGIQLFGLPQPSDNLWTSGDEISFSFNKDLDCALLSPSFIQENIWIFNESTQEMLDFNVSCYANKLIFNLNNNMSDYDGDHLTVHINDIPALAGNISGIYEWTFRVITQKLYWADADTIKVRMYKGTSQQIIARIENNTANQTVTGLSLSIEDGLSDWLSIIDPVSEPFAISPAGLNVEFLIDADRPLGIYNETITIDGIEAFGNTPRLHLQLEVLAKPPQWDVDPGEFSSSMNLISNWRFNTDTLGSRSRDIADLISVWINNEIRGVAPITQSQSFYASYLTVYGKPGDDPNAVLEFRIWDADEGMEYDAFPFLTPITFGINTSFGSTANPRMLIVDKTKDQARYIPLKNGWTGFSLNTSTDNMQVVKKLGTLTRLTEGDYIVHQGKFKQYSDALGWYNVGASDMQSFDVQKGYMINLQNGPDTLRVTGTVQTNPSPINLNYKWNWIGFPFIEEEEINQVLSNITNISDGDRIKLAFPLPGENQTFATYDSINNNWSDGNITNLEPNNLYKIYISNSSGAELNWEPTNQFYSPIKEKNSLLLTVADPSDASTWSLPEINADLVMPVVAKVVVDGLTAIDPNDKIAFFSQDTIKGYGQLFYISQLDEYVVSFVAEDMDGNYDIRYYDASEDIVYQASNQLSFDFNGQGDFSSPYPINIDTTPCPQVLVITQASSPFTSNSDFVASQMIQIEGIINIMDGVNVTFSAPIVKIIDRIDAAPGATVIIRPDGCQE